MELSPEPDQMLRPVTHTLACGGQALWWFLGQVTSLMQPEHGVQFYSFISFYHMDLWILILFYGRFVTKYCITHHSLWFEATIAYCRSHSPPCPPAPRFCGSWLPSSLPGWFCVRSLMGLLLGGQLGWGPLSTSWG